MSNVFSLSFFGFSRQKFAYSFALIVGLSFAGPAVACKAQAPESPAQESRRYHNKQLGYSFEIPANFRAMGVKYGVGIFEPSTFKFLQCVLKNKIGMSFPQDSLSVMAKPIVSRNRSLYNLVIEDSPWIAHGGFNFRTISFLGYQALSYSLMDRVDDITISYIALLTPDRKNLLTISGPKNGKELEHALSTFKFE